MPRVIRLLGAMLLVALASGCATITSGSSQSVSIDTDPSGAACTVVRRGETLGIVNPTPGSLHLSKGFAQLEIACRKDGHVEEQNEVQSSMQAVTFGNLLIGGGVGFAIDAMSGAMRSYPTTVRLILMPERFASDQARDDFFAGRRNNIEAIAMQRAESIRRNCKTDSCESVVTAIENEKRDQLAALEVRRTAVRPNPQ